MESFYASRHDRKVQWLIWCRSYTHFSLTDNLALFYYESEWAWMKQNQYQLSANEDTKMWKFGNRQCSHKPENT